MLHLTFAATFSAIFHLITFAADASVRAFHVNTDLLALPVVSATLVDICYIMVSVLLSKTVHEYIIKALIAQSSAKDRRRTCRTFAPWQLIIPNS